MRGRALGPGNLRKRNGRWVLSWTDETGRRRRKAIATTKADAERIRSEIIHRRDMAVAGLGSEAGQGELLSEVVAEYVSDLEPRVGPRHFKQVKSRLDGTVAALGEMRVRDLRPMHVVRIRNEAVTAGLSNRTANLVVTTLQSALRWAAENALIALNPIGHVRKLPESAEHRKVKRRPMTDEEIARFLAASEDDDEQCELLWDYVRVPQTPLWLAFLETGARYGELTRTTWADFDAKTRVLVLRAETTKSKKQRAIPLRDAMVERLMRLKALHETVHGRLPKASERIFLSPQGCPMPWHTANLSRVFHRLIKAAGIRKVDVQGRKLDIHALRHSAASRFARNGVPPMITQRIIGHSDIKTTMEVYSHLEAEDLRCAVDTLDTNEQQNRREAQ